jgi:nucleoside-diphosphate-sugar epimerase
MKVFVTGGTGYIGSAVVQHLVQGGHTVTGLVRPGREPGLTRLGAKALAGDVRVPGSYAALAAEHDALVHLAFNYGPDAAAADSIAVETLLAAALRAKAPRSVVYTSGVLVLGKAGTTPAYEGASTAAAFFNTWRPGHERLVLEANSAMVATAVIRPGWVYGGNGGLIAGYFETALDEGAAAYVGDGRNRMPLVHRDDVAELYRLVVAQRAIGIFHSIEEGSGRIAEYAAAASRAANKGGATRSIPLEEATKTLGPFAEAMCLDQWVGSRRAQTLGWKARPPFLQIAPEAFAEWRAARAGGA